MLKPSLQLKLTQQLTMTPQLQQAIRLLQLPIMELQTQIQTALDENVMLEVEEPENARAADATETTPPRTATATATATPTPRSSSRRQRHEPAEDSPRSPSRAKPTGRTRRRPARPKRRRAPSRRPTFEYADRSEETLRDHLLWQLELENLDARTTAIGQAIIDAINDDGYLTDDLETIRATLAPDVLASVEEIEQVLVELVQQFDPAGIGARSVSECVLLQLAQLAPDTPGLAARAHDRGRAPAARRRAAVRCAEAAAARCPTKSSTSRSRSCARAIRGRASSVFAPAAEYVVPDVFVRRSDGQWVVELNNAVSPQLRVNQIYAGSLGTRRGV